MSTSHIARILVSILAISGSVIAAGPPAVNLGTASQFTVLAKSGISTVPSSSIIGNIGVSPASGTFMTGFGLTKAATGTFSTSTQVIGQLLAADYTSPTPSQLITAVADMQTAFSDATGRINPDKLNLESGNIGGLSLTPGLYKWTTGVTIPTSVTLVGTILDTWIFQVAGTLTMAANKQVILSGSATAANVVWVVSSGVSIGAGSHFQGVVLGATSATLQTGATMNGRILSQTQVALQKASITPPSH